MTMKTKANLLPTILLQFKQKINLCIGSQLKPKIFLKTSAVLLYISLKNMNNWSKDFSKRKIFSLVFSKKYYFITI